MAKTHTTKPVPCPGCGVVVRRASSSENGPAPSKGDIAICSDCFSVCVFDDDQSQELADLDQLKRDHPQEYKKMMDFRQRFIDHMSKAKGRQ